MYYNTNGMHKSGRFWNVILSGKFICSFISVCLQNQCIVPTHTKPNIEHVAWYFFSSSSMLGFFLQGCILLKYRSINKIYYYADCVPLGEEENTECILRGKKNLIPGKIINSTTRQELEVLIKVVNPIRVFLDKG